VKIWPFATKSAGTPFSSATLSDLLASAFGGGATKSGASVNATTALEVSVVLGCVRVLAEGVAQVPWKVMRKEGRNKMEQVTHPLWMLLHRKPNRWQTSFEFRESMMIHALVGPNGAAYAFRSRVGQAQRLAELILLDPKRVKEIIADDGTRTYEVRGRNDATRTLTEDDVWRIPGPSWDGSTTLPLIRQAREAIGLAMSTEETQSKLHANGVQTSGIYSITGTLNAQGYKDLKAWVEKEHGGAKSAGKPMILDRDAKWLPNRMSGVEAQHLETRRHQVEEVCRAFRVLPIMVGQSDKASTYASAEQMFLAHLVHSLMPWYERIEQSADCNLLSDRELEQGYYTLLDPVGLLRGSLKDTAEYISKLTERGILTRNEGRFILDRNPIDGLDEPLTPINLLGNSSDPAGAPAGNSNG
jgi:HK97 family phage portal protein